MCDGVFHIHEVMTMTKKMRYDRFYSKGIDDYKKCVAKEHFL